MGSTNSDLVLQIITDSLKASIVLSLISHIISISTALESCIVEDVYQQRIASNLKLQIILLQNKFSQLRSSLILILLCQCFVSLFGFICVHQKIISLIFIYALIMLILFIIELKKFAYYLKFSSLLFHYLATVISFLLLLYNQLVPIV